MLTPTKLKYRTEKLSQNDFCHYVDEEARLSSYHIIVISTKEGGFTSRHVTKAPLYTPGGCCLTCRLQPAQQNQYLVKKILYFWSNLGRSYRLELKAPEPYCNPYYEQNISIDFALTKVSNDKYTTFIAYSQTPSSRH